MNHLTKQLLDFAGSPSERDHYTAHFHDNNGLRRKAVFVLAEYAFRNLDRFKAFMRQDERKVS